LTRFFSQATHTTDIYTLSLHDALPISRTRRCERNIANPVRKLHGKDARGKSQRDETQNSHRRPVLRSIALPDGLPPPRGSREERLAAGIGAAAHALGAGGAAGPRPTGIPAAAARPQGVAEPERALGVRLR